MDSLETMNIEELGKVKEVVNTVLNVMEEKCQRLYQNMFDAVFVYDYQKNKVLDCNEPEVELLGFSKSELQQYLYHFFLKI